MGWLARKIFNVRIQRMGPMDNISLERVRFDRGKVKLDDAIPSQLSTVASDSTSVES